VAVLAAPTSSCCCLSTLVLYSTAAPFHEVLTLSCVCFNSNARTRHQVVLRLKRLPDHWSASMRASMGMKRRNTQLGGSGGDEVEDPTEASALPEDDNGDDEFYDKGTTATLTRDTHLFTGGAQPRRATAHSAAGAAGASGGGAGAAGAREKEDERYVLSSRLRDEPSEYVDVDDSGNEDEENGFGFGCSVKVRVCEHQKHVCVWGWNNPHKPITLAYAHTRTHTPTRTN
jgi:hypothetical protein